MSFLQCCRHCTSVVAGSAPAPAQPDQKQSPSSSADPQAQTQTAEQDLPGKTPHATRPRLSIRIGGQLIAPAQTAHTTASHLPHEQDAPTSDEPQQQQQPVAEGSGLEQETGPRAREAAALPEASGYYRLGRGAVRGVLLALQLPNSHQVAVYRPATGAAAKPMLVSQLHNRYAAHHMSHSLCSRPGQESESSVSNDINDVGIDEGVLSVC